MISQMGSATHSCCWLFLLIRISLSPTPTPVALPAKGIVYLCTGAADDLSGQEISLNDPNFRARIGLGQT